MKHRSKWLILIALLILAYVGWRYRNRESSLQQTERAEDPSLILGRVWVDSRPEKPTDYLHALLIVNSLPVGIFQRSSAYRFLIERFEYTREDRTIRLRFPQSGRTDRFRYKITRCSDLPAFDLCLDLSKNPWEGPRRYYGKREQQKGPGRLEELQRSMRQHLLAD